MKYRVFQKNAQMFDIRISSFRGISKIHLWHFSTALSMYISKLSIFYFLVKFGPRYWQNTRRQSFQKLIFFVYYCSKHMTTQDPSGASWAHMSTHDHSWALMSTHDRLCVLMSAHECSSGLMSAHGPSFLLLTDPEWSFACYNKC